MKVVKWQIFEKNLSIIIKWFAHVFSLNIKEDQHQIMQKFFWHSFSSFYPQNRIITILNVIGIMPSNGRIWTESHCRWLNMNPWNFMFLLIKAKYVFFFVWKILLNQLIYLDLPEKDTSSFFMLFRIMNNYLFLAFEHCS